MNIDILGQKMIRCTEAVEAFNFTELTEDEHRDILSWRTHPDIALHSITKDIDWDSHMSFVENLKHTREQAYWVIKHHQKPVAVCNLFNITETSAYSGNYIVPGMIGFGVLANLVIHDIVFNKLKLEVLYGEISPDNHAALRMAQKYEVEMLPAKDGYIKVIHHREVWQRHAEKNAKLMNVFK